MRQARSSLSTSDSLKAIRLKKCAVYGCERPIRSGGFCNQHYKRVQRAGGVGKISLADLTKPIRGGRNGNATYLPAPAVTLHVYNAVNQAAEQEGITKHRKMVQILEKWATGYLRKSR